MIQYLIATIMIIIGFVCTCITNLVPCLCEHGSQNLINGGKVYNTNMSGDKKENDIREQTLKIIMPPKACDGCTILDVLQNETKAIKATPTFSLTLLPDAPRLNYRRRPFEVKGVIHWGQLKLMLSEIQFLSEHGHFSNTVVYAGASPGTHIKFLSKMFPNHKFILWDPRPFDVEGPMIETHEEYFTDDVAQKYAGQDILFISDIRTGDSQDAKCDFEGRVTVDMEWQMTWHKIIRPSMAMYKFRLPYTSGKTTYMDGTLQMQVFAPTSTTELRLIVPQEMRTTVYDNDEVEEQMYHFNYFVRPKWFGQTLRCCHLDGCWDCTAMIAILQMYLQIVKRYKAPNAKVGAVMMQKYVESVLATCSRVNRLDVRPHADGSNVGWFKRMHKYEGMRIENDRSGIVFPKNTIVDYKKIIAEAKNSDPAIIISPTNNVVLTKKKKYYKK
jgi:hypothetical protein